DGLVHRLLRLARETQDEGPVDHEPRALRVPGELDVLLDPDALLHVVQDALQERLVSDHEVTSTSIFHDSQRLVVEIAACVAAPRNPQRLEAASDLTRALLLEAERVVVEEELLHGAEVALRPRHLGDNVVDRARAVPVPARRLRPEAERTLGRAPPRR